VEGERKQTRRVGRSIFFGEEITSENAAAEEEGLHGVVDGVQTLGHSRIVLRHNKLRREGEIGR
jgi:hypothetical protein